MRGRFLRRKVRWLTLVVATLGAAWVLLGTTASAGAAEPAAPSVDSALAHLTQPVTAALAGSAPGAVGQAAVATVGGALDQVAATLLPSPETRQLADGLASAVTLPDAAPAAPEPATAPATVTTSAPASASASASGSGSGSGHIVSTLVGNVVHSSSTSLGGITSTLTQTTSTLTATVTSTVTSTVTQAAVAVPATAPVVDRLTATLASLAGSVDQLTSPASATLSQALAPVQQLLAPRSAEVPTTSGASTTPAGDLAAATVLPAPATQGVPPVALPPLLEGPSAGAASAGISVAGAGNAQSTALGAVSRAAEHPVSVASPTSDLGQLLAPRDGVPPSSPAPQHTPPSPAPTGSDGSGHAHFTLGIGALPTLLPLEEATRGASLRLPLSPTCEPGESPD